MDVFYRYTEKYVSLFVYICMRYGDIIGYKRDSMYNEDIDNSETKAILEGRPEAFERLFRVYYEDLCTYCQGILDDPVKAEDVVQDTFVYLWDHRKCIKIQVSLKAYLFHSVRHGALKVLRRQLMEQRHTPYLVEFIENLEQTEFSEEELADLEKVRQAIDNLPAQCKTVFLKSRLEDKSYKQIAEELGISSNTVKTHIVKAQRLIRENIQNSKSMVLLIWLLQYARNKYLKYFS